MSGCRLWKTDKSTISTLTVDGAMQGYVLEPSPAKIPAEMIFDVTVRPSAKHGGKMLPHIENVPGHVGIEIHIGNFPRDTEGCVLPGTERGIDEVLHSELAFGVLFGKINAALANGEKVQIQFIEGLN